MTKKRIIIILSVVISLVLIAAGVVIGVMLNQEEKVHREITLTEYIGTVEVIRDDEVLELSENMSLRGNDTIQAKSDSGATISIDDDKFLKLDNNTTIKLVSNEFDKLETRILISSGRLLVEIKDALAEGEEFLIEAPNSTMRLFGDNIAICSVNNYGTGIEIRHTLAEGNALVTSYTTDTLGRYLVAAAPLPMDEVFVLNVTSSQVFDSAEVDRIRRLAIKSDISSKGVQYDSLDKLIDNQEKLIVKRNEIKKSEKEFIRDNINKFVKKRYSLQVINSSFIISDKTVSEISYESDNEFEAKIKLNEGLELEYWLINGERFDKGSEFDIVVDKNILVEAVVVEAKLYNLTLTNTRILNDVGTEFISGTKLVLTPILGSVYKWVINGKEIDATSDTYTLYISEDTKVEAICIELGTNEGIVHLLNMSFKRPYEDGNVSSFDLNSRILIEAPRLEGKRIDHFIVNGEDVETNSYNLSLIVEKRLLIEAVYTDINYFSVSLRNAHFEDLGTIKNLEENTKIEVFANPKENQKVIGYNVNNSFIETTDLSIIVIANRKLEIEAVYSDKPLDLNIMIDDINGGTGSANGVDINDGIKLNNQVYGSVVHLEARPNEGYVFQGYWNKPYGEEGRHLISKELEYDLTLSNDTSVYLSFKEEKNKYLLIDHNGDMVFSNHTLYIDTFIAEEYGPILTDNLSLYYFSNLKNKYIPLDKANYRKEIVRGYFNEGDSENEIFEVVDEIDSNIWGRYLIRIYSLNEENPIAMDPVEEFEIIISPYREKPKYIARIEINHEKMEILPSEAFNSLAANYGQSQIEVRSDSNAISVSKNNQVYLNNNLLRTGTIVKKGNKFYFKNLKIEMAKGYSLYGIVNNDLVEIKSIESFGFSSNELVEMYFAPSGRYIDNMDNEYGISMLVGIRIHIVYPLISVVIPNNKLGDNPTSPKYYEYYVEEEDTSQRLYHLNSYENDAFPVYNGLDAIYHEEDGGIRIRVYSTSNLEVYDMNNRLLKKLKKMEAGDVLIYPTCKSILNETIYNPLGMGGLHKYTLYYDFKLRVGNREYPFRLCYDVVGSEHLDEIKEISKTAHGEEFTNKHITKSLEELGYDEALFNKYFKVGGAGYDIPIIDEI